MADELQLIVTQPPEVVVTVAATEPPVLQLTVAPPTEIVRTFAIGPQGPGFTSLTTVPDVDAGARIDKSLLYYDAASSKFKLDASITTTTLTDGGNY